MEANKHDFIWYELMTPHLDGAASFYRDLIGWNLSDVGGGPGMRYFAATMGTGTRGVAGMMELSAPMRDAGARPGWIGYIFTEDVDGAAASLQQAGGNVFRQPADIPGVGRFAVVADPQGAIFYLFKPAPQGEVPPRLDQGAIGNVGWHELMTNNWEQAWSFYSSQFGWTLSQGYDMGPAGVYQTFSSNELPMTGGMMSIPASIREQMPHPFWRFYFNVEDIRDAERKITANGGQVQQGPMQVPGGGWIINGVDPHGVHFSLLSRNG